MIITNPSRKIKVLVTMLLILIASIWFAIQSQPAPASSQREGRPVVGEIVLSLDQALNLSLACGDYRRINWERVA